MKISRKHYFIMTAAFAVGFGAGLLAIPKIEVGNYVDQLLSQFPPLSGFVSPKAEVEAFDLSGKAPQLMAKAYVVVDLQSGSVIKEKLKSSQLPIASVSKLMTALVAVENIPESLDTKVSKAAVLAYGLEGGLHAGETMPAHTLLYPMLLESSNDAAEAVAESIGRPAFMDLMNKKAAALGMTKTHYEDPSGLNPGNVSSAEDLVKLVTFVYKNHPEIFAITRLSSYAQKKTAKYSAHTWYSQNRYVTSKKPGYLGGKNGYIPESEQTGIALFNLPVKAKITTASNNTAIAAETRPVVAIVLKSTARYRDLDALFSFVKTGVLYTHAPSRKASLVFAGDIMTDRAVGDYVNTIKKGDFSSLFKNSFFIKNATVAFANLEGPVSDKGYDLGNLYSFRMNPKTVDALAATGFDAVSVANNHIGDWGRTAYEDTLARLNNAGIQAVGGGADGVDARRVKIIDANGLKIGYLGFTDVGPDWLGENDNLPVILTPKITDFDDVIKKAAAQVDHLVVSFHFGQEYEDHPTARQKELAHRAVDDGADIIIGTHPHVIEDVERYKGAVIAYSLGNFVFDQTFSDKTRQGMALEVVVDGKTISEVNQGLVRINDEYQPTLVESQDL